MLAKRAFFCVLQAWLYSPLQIARSSGVLQVSFTSTSTGHSFLIAPMVDRFMFPGAPGLTSALPDFREARGSVW
jgi:hypothetical protein